MYKIVQLLWFCSRRKQKLSFSSALSTEQNFPLFSILHIKLFGDKQKGHLLGSIETTSHMQWEFDVGAILINPTYSFVKHLVGIFKILRRFKRFAKCPTSICTCSSTCSMIPQWFLGQEAPMPTKNFLNTAKKFQRRIYQALKELFNMLVQQQCLEKMRCTIFWHTATHC